jgi:hypothetical protein
MPKLLMDSPLVNELPKEKDFIASNHIDTSPPPQPYFNYSIFWWKIKKTLSLILCVAKDGRPAFFLSLYLC